MFHYLFKDEFVTLLSLKVPSGEVPLLTCCADLTSSTTPPPPPPPLFCSPVDQKRLLSGLHFVRDLSCKRCASRLGWFYEMAVDGRNRDKEGRSCLENGLLVRTDGPDKAGNVVEQMGELEVDIDDEDSEDEVGQQEIDGF